MLSPELAAWQSDAALTEIEPRIQTIERLARTYEVPLLNALEEEYGPQRGWRVCGPSSIVLAHLMSEDTGIPLIPFPDDRTKECFSLEMYMFNALGDPAWPAKDEHTNVQYHTGAGFSLTIDPVYQLLWRGAKKGPNAFLMEWHYDHHQNEDLQTFYNLRTMRHFIGGYTTVDRGFPNLWGRPDTKGSYQDFMNMLRVMHSPAVFEDIVQLWSGEVMEVGAFWGQRLGRVRDAVRAQVPSSALVAGGIAEALVPALAAGQSAVVAP